MEDRNAWGEALNEAESLRAFPLVGESAFPDFREFYREHNPQFMGVWPCPRGTHIEDLHRALADTAADYFDVIRAVLLGRGT